MSTSRRFGLFLLALVLCAAQRGFADTLSIIILPSGTDYYEWNLTGGGTSGWIEQTATQVNYDDMTTSPGGSSTVGTTQYFSLMANSGLSVNIGGNTYSILQTGSSYWRQISGTNTTTEAGLVGTVTGTPSSTSAVQNLFIEDGMGGIFTYKAPNSGTGTITNTNPSGQNAYGYEAAWNPAVDGSPTGVPITQVGTLTSGLEGALESNAGFVGDGSGTNIATQGEQLGLTNPDPAISTLFNGYVFSGSSQPGSVREGINGNFAGAPGGYLNPTVYYEVVVPEPASVGVLAVVGSVLLARRKRRSL